MKQAWAFALGALGLLAFANYRKSGTRHKAERIIEQPKPRRARKMRGDVLANRIVDNRPYLTKIDLVGRRIIPEAVYETIKHSITVKHAA
ncbi:MAG: hypothetical protein DMG64_11570 [Acidobacteria bacterium]|nr:MAG: hypothetical protein DMG64_11570 [Acidobacteriota bacterium]